MSIASRSTGRHIGAAGIVGATALAAELAFGIAPAVAEFALTMHLEEQAVQDFKPFDLVIEQVGPNHFVRALGAAR